MQKKFNFGLIVIFTTLMFFWMIFIMQITGCSSNPSKEANKYYESIKDSIDYDGEIDSLYNIYFPDDTTNMY